MFRSLLAKASRAVLNLSDKADQASPINSIFAVQMIYYGLQ